MVYLSMLVSTLKSSMVSLTNVCRHCDEALIFWLLLRQADQSRSLYLNLRSRYADDLLVSSDKWSNFVQKDLPKQLHHRRLCRT